MYLGGDAKSPTIHSAERSEPMFRHLTSVIRSRPWTTLLVLVFLLLAGTAIGLYCLARHQWDEAQAALKVDPKEVRGKLDVCFLICPLGLPGSPSCADVHLLAARAARLRADFDEAAAHLKECTRLNGGATVATQLEYLLMRAQTGEEDQVAEDLFALVEKKHPEAVAIMETLAAAYMRHLRYGPAYACLTRWIKEAPGSAKPYHWRGWVLERMDNHKEAMLDYEQALKLDPELAPARLRVAEMLLEEKQPADAIPHLERLRRQFPDKPELLARLGQCRYLQGRAPEARQLLQTAVKKLPDNPSVLLHLAKLDLQDGSPARAERWLRHALKVDPADTEAQFTLISCLQLQGRGSEAVTARAKYEKDKALLERANKLLTSEAKHPTKDPAAPFEIGSVLLKVGQERLGLYWLRQALARDANHQATHLALAEYYERKGDKESAAIHRRRLAKK
jgi:tetratricopeptide (TPR) repeat protein